MHFLKILQKNGKKRKKLAQGESQRLGEQNKIQCQIKISFKCVCSGIRNLKLILLHNMFSNTLALEKNSFMYMDLVSRFWFRLRTRF